MSFRNTRDFIIHARRFIKGDTLDFGAGRAKYRSVIEPNTSKYTTFDMAGEVDVVGDVLNPPFVENTFDTVISTQVLEHVKRPWVMVHNMVKILKKDGLCIATAPFMFPYHPDPGDYFRYSTEGLKNLFLDEGCEIVESGSYGRAFGLFAELIHFSLFNPYKGHGRFGRFVMQYVEKIAYFLDRFLSGKMIYVNVYVVAKKL